MSMTILPEKSVKERIFDLSGEGLTPMSDWFMDNYLPISVVATGLCPSALKRIESECGTAKLMDQWTDKKGQYVTCYLHLTYEDGTPRGALMYKAFIHCQTYRIECNETMDLSDGTVVQRLSQRLAQLKTRHAAHQCLVCGKPLPWVDVRLNNTIHKHCDGHFLSRKCIPGKPMSV